MLFLQKKKVFMQKYNIIIPTVYRDYSFLKKTICYIFKNLDPVKIYIITDEKMSRFIPKSIIRHSQCEVLIEDEIISGLTFKTIQQILKKQGRMHTKVGWYFQQFLKIGFSCSQFCTTDYYLSWDADTVPLKRIDLFDKDGHPYFTMKSEYHKPYFDTMERVLSMGKTNPCSYIAEHMMFSKKIVCELIGKIMESDVKGDTWFEKILNSLAPEEISPFSFSEFETYGTFCCTFYPQLYKERHLSGFRKAGLIQGRFVSDQILENLAEDVDVASFEIYDRPPFPWGIICHYYEKFGKYKELFLRYIIDER